MGVSPLNSSLLAFKAANPIDIDVYHIIIAETHDNVCVRVSVCLCLVSALSCDFKATDYLYM